MPLKPCRTTCSCGQDCCRASVSASHRYVCLSREDWRIHRLLGFNTDGPITQEVRDPNQMPPAQRVADAKRTHRYNKAPDRVPADFADLPEVLG